VDGKSIMGIFSLDLLNPIKMIVHSDDCPELMAELASFVVEAPLEEEDPKKKKKKK
jgi:hypothetical protein